MTERLGRARPAYPLARLGRHGAGRRDPRPRGATTALDVIAITDHERIDAARRRPRDGRGPRAAGRVIVGEEVTTLGGHLLGAVPRGAGQAVPVAARDDRRDPRPGRARDPRPSSRALPAVRPGLRPAPAVADPDPRVRPDALEAFNPTMFGRHWHAKVVAFADGARPRRGSATATRTRSTAIGRGWTTFPGTTPDDLRAAIAAGSTQQHGSFHGTIGQVGTFAKQLRKYGRDARAELGGRIRRDGTGRDLGYPVARAAARRVRARRRRDDEDRPRLALHLPAARRRHAARRLPVREPPSARARRPDHHLIARPPAVVRGRRHPHRQGLLGAHQRLRGHVDGLAASSARSATSWIASSSTCSTSTSRSCPSSRSSCCASPRA